MAEMTHDARTETMKTQMAENFDEFEAEYREEDHWTVVYEDDQVVVVADHTGHELNEYAKEFDVSRRELSEIMHDLARDLCDHNWSASDPIVFDKPARTAAPVHDSIVADMSANYDLDEDAFRAFLADAASEWSDLLSELRESHEIVAESDDRVVVLAQYGDEVDVMADHLADTHTDVGFWEPDATPAHMLREAMDRQAREYEFDAFGGRQSAVDATGTADAIILR